MTKDEKSDVMKLPKRKPGDPIYDLDWEAVFGDIFGNLEVGASDTPQKRRAKKRRNS